MKSTENRLQRLARILEISRELTATVSLERLLHRIVAAAVELTDCETAGILLLDEASGELRFMAAFCFADQLAGIPVPIEASIAGAALVSGEPVVVPDARVDPRHYPVVEQLIGLEARSLLAVPLQFQDRRIGVLEAENKRQGEFDQEDVETLILLAAQAAVAIETARLYEQAQQELAERMRVEQELREHRDRLEEAVAERTAELTQAITKAERLNEQLQRDIAVRKQVEVALRKAKEAAEEALVGAEAATRAKSTFLANMSHEMRTPLNAIINYSELLHEEAEDLGHTDLIPDLKKIRTAARHLLALISDVLDLSKIEAGKADLLLEPFDIPTLIRNVVITSQPLAARNGNALQVHCPADLGSMYADRIKVRQILINLLSNAAKFTRHGTITLAVSRETAVARESWATQEEKGQEERICFCVTDTGIGMSPEQKHKLFQPFTQAESATVRQHGGTGLGLALSARFCWMMNGSIGVESELNHGSAFTVRLPAQVPEPPDQSPLSMEKE